jgi:hypothetical protein
MFGLLGKKSKEDAIDEETLLIAGLSAGIAFRRSEKIIGAMAMNETIALIETSKKTACDMLKINPDEKSRKVMHMITLAFAMDDSGFAQKITNRYAQGDTSFYPEEAKKLWNLTLLKSREISNHFSKNG